MGIILEMYKEVIGKETSNLIDDSQPEGNKPKQCPCDYGICSECEY